MPFEAGRAGGPSGAESGRGCCCGVAPQPPPTLGVRVRRVRALCTRKRGDVGAGARKRAMVHRAPVCARLPPRTAPVDSRWEGGG